MKYSTKPDKKVHRLILHDRKARRDKSVADLNLSSVHTPEDTLLSDADGHAGEARVEKTHTVAALGASLTHDRHLSSRIDKCYEKN